MVLSSLVSGSIAGDEQEALRAPCRRTKPGNPREIGEIASRSAVATSDVAWRLASVS
jgi:hypothetical protein